MAITVLGEGEICVRGRNVMLGYFGDDAATRSAIDPTGKRATAHNYIGPACMVVVYIVMVYNYIGP